MNLSISMGGILESGRCPRQERLSADLRASMWSKVVWAPGAGGGPSVADASGEWSANAYRTLLTYFQEVLMGPGSGAVV